MDQSFFLHIIKDPLNIGVLILGGAASVWAHHFYAKKIQSRAVLSYLSNIWTSLGILGTFIAIVSALGGIDRWDELDIGTIIKRIVPAFITSIIGIIGAIVSAIHIKTIFAKEDAAYEELNRMQLHDPMATPEMALDSIRSNTAELNTRLDSLTNRITEGILDEVHQAISMKFAEIAQNHSAELVRIFGQEKETLADLSNMIVTSIEKLAGDLASQFADSIRDVKEKTVSSISESVEVQSDFLFGKVTTAAEALVGKINEMQAAIVSDSLINHKTLIDGVSARTKDAVDAFAQSIGKQTEASEKLTDTLIKRIGEVVKEFSDNTESTQLILNDLLGQMKTYAGENVSKIKSAMTAVVKDGADALKSGIDTNITTLNGLTTDLSKTLGPLIAAIGSSYQNYDKTFRSAEKILVRLEEAETKLDIVLSSFVRNTGEMEEYLTKLEEISEANRMLNYRINELHRAFASGGKPLPAECPHCGAEVENPIARFCGRCGHDLYEEEHT